jgi:CheY-like chemotaxis protein
MPKNTSYELKKQAEEANRAQTNFIANISHDIRTPLHTILGTTELLKIKQHLPEQTQHLDAIIQSGETLLKLVENILDFSTLEQDKIALHDEPIDLLQLIKNAVATISHQANDKGIEVIINYRENVPKNLLSNADAVSRIMLNLLSNAVKFTDAGQIVVSIETVKTTEHTITLSLSIKDTGIGIAQHEIKNIFERFYRVNPAYKGRYKGAGLGLAITKKIVESLKGTISVESHPGVGSEFTCILPFRKTPPEKICSQALNGYLAANEKRQEKLSVLLVEDVPLIQKFSMDILESLGCKVTLANNATEAIAFGKNHYDLIFMDIGLPDDDGLSVIRQLRKNQHHLQTPIIALTAHATDEVRQDCFAAGVNDFLAKPASYKTLLQCINKYAV